MKDPIRAAHDVEETNGGNASTSVVDRRAASRQQFVAEAQIVEIKSGLRLSARSCDLVLTGCYVDTLRPFPVGTLVRIRLKKDGTAIEVNGNVVYELPGLGMGIAFHDVTPESRSVMDKWLSKTGVREESVEALLPAMDAAPPPVIQQQSRTEFLELVELLMRKGILTRAEAASFMKGSTEE